MTREKHPGAAPVAVAGRGRELDCEDCRFEMIL